MSNGIYICVRFHQIIPQKVIIIVFPLSIYENACFLTAFTTQYVVFLFIFANLIDENGILEWF